MQPDKIQSAWIQQNLKPEDLPQTSVLCVNEPPSHTAPLFCSDLCVVSLSVERMETDGLPR